MQVDTLNLFVFLGFLDRTQNIFQSVCGNSVFKELVYGTRLIALLNGTFQFKRKTELGMTKVSLSEEAIIPASMPIPRMIKMNPQISTPVMVARVLRRNSFIISRF